MDDVEDVIPEVVILTDMTVEPTLTHLIKDETIRVANEAHVLCVHLQELLLLSHFGESVNDDTEEDVEEDDFHEDMEHGVVA